MEEAEVGFEVGVVRFRGWSSGPKEGVVVREQGEDDPQEEGCRCERNYAG